MRRLVCAAVMMVISSCFVAAQQSKPPVAMSKSAQAPALQAKIEQAWKDWVKKDRQAVDRILADDAVEIWADGKGPRGKKSTLDGMAGMNIEKYALSDFKFTPLGEKVELATYRATVRFHGAAQPDNVDVSEVWVKRGSEWKIVHYQETEIK